MYDSCANPHGEGRRAAGRGSLQGAEAQRQRVIAPTQSGRAPRRQSVGTGILLGPTTNPPATWPALGAGGSAEWRCFYSEYMEYGLERGPREK